MKNKRRKQRTQVNSILPLSIGEDYVFIRRDFFFLFFSKILFLITLVFGRVFFRVVGSHAILGRNKISGLNHLGFISIANHCHYLDGALTSSALGPRTIWFPSVQRNFETPYLRRILRLLKGFPLPANPFGLIQIMKSCIDAIAKGEVINFNPEAELWHLHQGIGTFQTGAFYLAHEANCPVVPVVHLFKPKTLFGRKISNQILDITSVIGDPIYPSNPRSLNKNERHIESVKIMTDQARDWMEKEMFESVKIMTEQAHDWMEKEMLEYKMKNDLL
jgi:1-acyl-sn-glycerol-3-phosphate acyltransferase